MGNILTEHTFTILIEADEDSGFTARCLELKGIYGQGEIEEEALQDIQAALDLALEYYQEEKLRLPYRKVVQVTKDISSASTAT